MSQFVRFPSIREDWRGRAFEYPEFHESQFAVTEKIDGANVQFYFHKNQPLRVGKRTGFVKKPAMFFNLASVMEQRQPELRELAEYASAKNLRLRVFGELFGSQVIARIDYGTLGDLRFFQMDIDEVRIPLAEMAELLAELGLSHLLVPILDRCDVETALGYQPVFPSALNPAVMAEGCVVSGWDKTFNGRDGRPFLCKIKNPDFADVEGGEVDNPVYEPVTRYINRNRIVSVSSKHGAFNDRKRFPEYLQLLLDEINADYIQDYGPDTGVTAEKYRHQVAALLNAWLREQG